MHMAHIVRPRAVVAYVIRKESATPTFTYLLMRRSSSYLKGAWLTVGGGIEEDERAPQAAHREIFEETGLKPTRFYSNGLVEMFYDRRTDSIMINPVFIAFIDNNQEVVLSPNEHDSYEWVTYENAMRMLEFSEQRRVLTHIHEAFVLKTPNELFAIQLD